jgi:hypothetical protein
MAAQRVINPEPTETRAISAIECIEVTYPSGITLDFDKDIEDAHYGRYVHGGSFRYGQGDQ